MAGELLIRGPDDTQLALFRPEKSRFPEQSWSLAATMVKALVHALTDQQYTGRIDLFLAYSAPLPTCRFLMVVVV